MCKRDFIEWISVKKQFKKILHEFQPNFYYNARYHKQGERSNRSKGTINSTLESCTKSLKMRKKLQHVFEYLSKLSTKVLKHISKSSNDDLHKKNFKIWKRR